MFVRLLCPFDTVAPEIAIDSSSSLIPCGGSVCCQECEHNLSKPDFNPLSIKFKIQLIAL